MKIISFLGTANYSPTTYCWQGKEATSRFFPAALAAFVHPDLHLICATPTLRGDKSGQAHPNLTELLDELSRLEVTTKVIPIEEAHSETDLWKIFNTLTQTVKPNETIIFDLTYSFRSIPFLSFMAIAFLRAARQVEVKHVLYGAYEARTTDNRSPVFDLTPFIKLFDWLTATDQFLQTGNAYRLADLIRPTGDEYPAQLAVANNLLSVSQAALLCQPFALMDCAPLLVSSLEQAKNELDDMAPPFQVLGERISQEFRQFALDPNADTVEWVMAEACLIQWYYDNGQFVQAVSLAREWLEDAVCYRLGRPKDFSMRARRELAEAFHGLKEALRPDNKLNRDNLSAVGKQLYDWPPEERERLVRLWLVLSSTRNTLDHAEHLEYRVSMDQFQTNIAEIVHLCNELAHCWHIGSDKKITGS